MESWVQVLETASCRNAGKGCVHKAQSGWTLPQTLQAGTGCSFFTFIGCLFKIIGMHAVGLYYVTTTTATNPFSPKQVGVG
jgi:hypothetical protein